eukprot:jgi/Tetstr1/459227/TSEL_000037.t1
MIAFACVYSTSDPHLGQRPPMVHPGDRGDRGGAQQAGGRKAGGGGGDWPRNGALLKGDVYQHSSGKKFLHCLEIQQAGSQGFQSVSGPDKWMPFDGGSSNGGMWLHPVN